MGRLAVFVALLLAVCIAEVSAFYSSSGPVVSLTASNFESKIKSGGVWLVEFYAPWCGHCQSLKPTWEQTAQALQGIVNVAAVDCDQHQAIAQQYGVQGFPTIKFLYNSKGTIKTVDYNGGRSAKELVTFSMDKARAYALKQLGDKPSSSSSSSGGSKKGSSGGKATSEFYGEGSDVINLTDGNFDEEVLQSSDLWFIEFYAPWCGHCKNLKPVWSDSASQLKDKVKVGAVDCTAHQQTCSQFGIKGYPTIKFFGISKDHPAEYQGGRDSGSIVEYALKRWSEDQPAPEVRELVDQAIWETECIGFNEPGLEKAKSKTLCFLAFLPNILDSKAAGRQAYLDPLKQLAETNKGRPWSFSVLWTEGGKQPDLESNFGIGGFGYPALVAFRPDDGKFSTMRSAFEHEHVLEFVKNIRWEPVNKILGDQLAEVATTQPWDGKDAEVELEDEFDLDDIMKQEL
eukprot:jgi/Chrzof1/3389/Cz12g23180.t1_PDI4